MERGRTRARGGKGCCLQITLPVRRDRSKRSEKSCPCITSQLPLHTHTPVFRTAPTLSTHVCLQYFSLAASRNYVYGWGGNNYFSVGVGPHHLRVPEPMRVKGPLSDGTWTILGIAAGVLAGLGRGRHALQIGVCGSMLKHQRKHTAFGVSCLLYFAKDSVRIPNHSGQGCHSCGNPRT